jgi:hypothetical protein
LRSRDRKTTIAEKPRGLAACPGRVPSLSAYAYQSSVSLLLAGEIKALFKQTLEVDRARELK